MLTANADSDVETHLYSTTAYSKIISSVSVHNSVLYN